MIECWYKNNSSFDINLNDLNLKIPANGTVNLFRLRRSLTVADIRKSEAEGLLGRCVSQNKLIKLPFAPRAQHYEMSDTIKESTKPLPSRVKTSVIVDIGNEEMIDEMDQVQVGSISDDGVGDPLSLRSDADTFSTISISVDDEEISAEEINDAEAIINPSGVGKNRFFTVSPKE